MPDRRRPLVMAVLAALVAGMLAAALAGWSQLRPSETKAAAGGAGPSRTAPAPAAPVEPVTSAAVAPPLPEPGAASVTVAGSRLRRGVARPISSPATIADVNGPRIGLYSAPGRAEAEPDDTFQNPTWEGLPLVFLVQQRQGDWLEVQLNTRPNQTTAWIRAADVTLRTTTQRIVVSLAARSLTVYDGQTAVMEVPVAVGTSSTPTPRGNYYIDGAVRTPDPGGVYGPFQLSVAAFSEVLMSFGTGVGQIALHGTNSPGLIGSAVSNGCLRMTNADVTRLAYTVDIGTPVQIA